MCSTHFKIILPEINYRTIIATYKLYLLPDYIALEQPDANVLMLLKFDHSSIFLLICLQIISCNYTCCKYMLSFISARPWSAEYKIEICFETAKNTKVFECFFTGFQHSLWKFSATGYLYSLKSWLWLVAVECVVRWPISKALLNDIWLTCFTRMCN